MNTILVIGGTGTTGKFLVDQLHENNASFKVLVRNNEKANRLQGMGIQTCPGSLGDWESIENSLENIDTVFLLSSPSPAKVIEQNGLIDLAVKNEVRKIVKISAVVAKTGSNIHLANWHGQIEDHLIASGLEFVILRPHSFMQNILMSLPTIKSNGAFYESMGDAKIPMVDARDVAKAAYHCLISDKHNSGNFLITGGELVSYHDMANALTKAAAKQIQFINIPSEVHNQGMKSAGLPDWLADDLTIMSSMWSKQSTHTISPDFGRITHSKQISLDQFAMDYAQFLK